MLWPLVLGLWSLPPARAVITEPDNVVYGAIWDWNSTNRITALSTNVVVQVQAPDGAVLSSYRMGQDPSLGDYYAVQIGFWSSEALNPVPPPSGSNVLVVVLTQSAGHHATNYVTNYVVGDRGYVQRIDFGAAPTNGLTGFDAWAAAWGVGGSSQSLDSDGDGLSNYNEYVAGTTPTNSQSRFLLRMARAQTNAEVSFDAVRAEGAGYAGLNRHYALERLAGLGSGNWQAVPGYADVVGSNQVVVCTTPATGGPLFFRGKVWLAAESSSPGDLRLLVGRDAGQMVISFTALGPDTQGRNRYYTLERTTNLVSGAWVAVPGYSNVLGAGQTVTSSVPAAGTGRSFYRGRVELRSP